MKRAAFVLGVVLVGAALLPSEAQHQSAMRLSDPHPELEVYLRGRIGKHRAAALRELVRIERCRSDRRGEIRDREALRLLAPDDDENLFGLLELYGWENLGDRALEVGDDLAKRFPDRQDLRERVLEIAEAVGRPEVGHPHARWLAQRGRAGPATIRNLVAMRDAEGIRAAVRAPRERARALVAIGAQPDAIEAYREHLSASPCDFEARRALADLHVWNGAPMLAAEQWEACGAHDRVVAIYRDLHRTDLLLRWLPDGPERADALAALGRVEEAIELCRRIDDRARLLVLVEAAGSEEEEIALRERMTMDEANLRKLAALYAWRKQTDRAAALYERLNDPRAADLYVQRGDWDSALRVLRDDGSPERLARIYLRTGDLARAAEEYRKVPGMESEVAELLLQLGRFEEAVPIIEGLACDPHERAAMFLRARRADRAALLLISMAEEPESGFVETVAAALDRPDVEPFLRAFYQRHPRNEEGLRMLAELAVEAGSLEEAAVLYRALVEIRGDDAEARQMLAELDREIAERREDLADAWIEAGRLDEAEALGLTPRQRATVALKRGRLAEAIDILRTLDLSDPDVRSALAESLLTLGRWQEADEFADAELKREIRGSYGPESSAQIGVFNAADERHWTMALRGRTQISQPLLARMDLSHTTMTGRVEALALDETRAVETAATRFFYRVDPSIRIGAGLGLWRSELATSLLGSIESELRRPEWSVGLSAGLGEPWRDSLEAVAFGGIRHRLSLQATGRPLDRLFLSGSIEELWYRLLDDRGTGAEASFGDEFRARLRSEYRLWSGPGTAGRDFFDPTLEDDAILESHASVVAQLDLTELSADDSHQALVPVSPRSRMFTFGPAAAWGAGIWGAEAALATGVDPGRGLGFGDVWILHAAVLVAVADRLQLSLAWDYSSERLEEGGGAAWAASFGANFNF